VSQGIEINDDVVSGMNHISSSTPNFKN